MERNLLSIKKQSIPKSVKSINRDKASISRKVFLIWSITIVHSYINFTTRTHTADKSVNKCLWQRKPFFQNHSFSLLACSERRATLCNDMSFLDHPNHVQYDWGPETSRKYGNYPLFKKKIMNNVRRVRHRIIVYKHDIWVYNTTEHSHIGLRNFTCNVPRPVVQCVSFIASIKRAWL